MLDREYIEKTIIREKKLKKGNKLLSKRLTKIPKELRKDLVKLYSRIYPVYDENPYERLAKAYGYKTKEEILERMKTKYIEEK